MVGFWHFTYATENSQFCRYSSAITNKILLHFSTKFKSAVQCSEAALMWTAAQNPQQSIMQHQRCDKIHKQDMVCLFYVYSSSLKNCANLPLLCLLWYILKKAGLYSTLSCEHHFTDLCLNFSKSEWADLLTLHIH